jgi:hypothetical protein
VCREAATFPVVLVVFGAGLSAPTAAVGCLDAVAFLLAGAVGLTCVAAALMCRLGRGGMKRARAAAPGVGAAASVWRMHADAAQRRRRRRWGGIE